MTMNDKLDRVMQYFYYAQDLGGGTDFENIYKLMTEMNQYDEKTAFEDAEAIVHQLEKIGFISRRKDGHIGKLSFDRGHFITVEGMQFFETPWIIFKKKPFAYKDLKSKLSILWKIASITAAIANSLAILYLGWLQLNS